MSNILKILVPSDSGIYRIAAGEFISFWQRTTGQQLSVITGDDGSSDLVILGSDAVNAFTHAKIMENVIPQFKIRSGSDDYQLFSASENGRNYLFIAGGRPRSLLYGVYHFFEHVSGCSYFWDGDLIPETAAIDITGINMVCSPRFEYRGLRYFAHRSLNRFQAEHWDFDEWKQEIDWIIKKRLNTFMLRIGLDDLFQRTFPDIVKYPSWHVPESIPRSYDDRDLFWPLEYRGELRRKILAYARERDLLYPEDVGTFTHWYSRTPLDFLKHVNPGFIPQATASYNQETGLVWDISKDENLDNYFKITMQSIKDNGTPALFHTIGLAERLCFKDHRKNHQMKLYTYRRIISKLREKFPDTPLMIGSWDFGMYWSCDEVKELIRELDPRNTFIFDYTSDVANEENNFTRWGVLNRFPWMFGIFHAYEPANGPQGNYDRIAQRLPLAAADPMCKGFFYWPECSHSDTLMLEFMAAKAWDPAGSDVESFLPEFCRKRYPACSGTMLEIWQQAITLIKLAFWYSPHDPEILPGYFCDELFHILRNDFYSHLDEPFLQRHRRMVNHMSPAIAAAPALFEALSKIADKTDLFLLRDVTDLARMAVARVQNFAFSKLALEMEAWRSGKAAADTIKYLLKQLCLMTELEYHLVSTHPDYSMYNSLKLLEQKHETNPDFEKTLKANAENSYCRSCITELFPGIYLPQLKFYADWVSGKLDSGDTSPWRRTAGFDSAIQQIRDEFYNTPLAELAAACAGINDRPELLASLAHCAQQLIGKMDIIEN